MTAAEEKEEEGRGQGCMDFHKKNTLCTGSDL